MKKFRKKKYRKVRWPHLVLPRQKIRVIIISIGSSVVTFAYDDPGVGPMVEVFLESYAKGIASSGFVFKIDRITVPFR